jgi:hypothetical protein
MQGARAESLTISRTCKSIGLLASTGRIRQSAARSQATMVGGRKKYVATAPALSQQHTLNTRSCAHRRRVDGSGKRDGSLQCGARLLNGSTCGDAFTSLLSATQAERSRRRQPIGQDREGLVARMTDSASHPNAIMVFIAGPAKPPSVTDDRPVAAKRAQPREKLQRDLGHPGSVLFSVSGGATKRTTLARGPPQTVLPSSARVAGRPLLVSPVSNKKEY